MPNARPIAVMTRAWLPIAFVAAACAALPAAAAEYAMQAARDVHRGRYLVAITGCNDCHTRDYVARGERVPEAERLTGSPLGWHGPWGTTYASNLRLYFAALTEEQWIELASEIQRQPPMPYYALNAMSESDLRAMYRYIRALGPAGEPAPAAIPPGITPPAPYVTFPTIAAPARAAARRR